VQNLSAATHSQEREKIGAAEGQIDARNAITASAGQENMGRLVTGERMAAREQLSSARTLREARADFQATPEGYMSTADSLKASRLEANKRIGASIGAQKQEIAQEQEDIAKALRDGNPAPRLADHVIAGTEAAKSKTDRSRLRPAPGRRQRRPYRHRCQHQTAHRRRRLYGRAQHRHRRRRRQSHRQRR